MAVRPTPFPPAKYYSGPVRCTCAGGPELSVSKRVESSGPRTTIRAAGRCPFTMKSLARVGLSAAFAVLACASASAQDAAAPIRRSTPAPEQTATPAPAATSSATPEATPQSQASPPAESSPASPPPEPPKASPATEAPPTSRRTTTSGRDSALRPKPVRALERGTPFIRRLPAEPNPGARASRPTFDLSDGNWATAATIRSLEKRWQNAIKNRDVDALDRLLADNFSGTSVNGGEASKERMLSLLRADKNTYRSARVQRMSVRNMGPSTAVVTGVATESGVTEDGRKFDVARRFTNTWKLRDGRWQCVASRVTQLPDR